MKRLEKQTKQTIGWFALSCLLPIGMMAIAYFINGIYFGSTRTILASDSFSQYANFHASFNNVLHGKQSIFYTWYASLGLNYWSFSAYYLNGIFTPIVFSSIIKPYQMHYISLPYLNLVQWVGHFGFILSKPSSCQIVFMWPLVQSML